MRHLASISLIDQCRTLPNCEDLVKRTETSEYSWGFAGCSSLDALESCKTRRIVICGVMYPDNREKEVMMIHGAHTIPTESNTSVQS
jgi:hypothetical protein